MSILNWVTIFSELTSSELQNLEIFCQERIVQSWELLIKQGDEGNSMYIVKAWLFEVYKEEFAIKTVLWLIKTWDFVWEMAIFGNVKKRMASVKAVENSRVIVLLEFALKDLCSKYPDLYNKISVIINKRIEENRGK